MCVHSVPTYWVQQPLYTIRLGVAAARDGLPGHVPRAAAEPVAVSRGLPPAAGVRLGLPLAPVPDHGERGGGSKTTETDMDGNKMATAYLLQRGGRGVIEFI